METSVPEKEKIALREEIASQVYDRIVNPSVLTTVVAWEITDNARPYIFGEKSDRIRFGWVDGNKKISEYVRGKDISSRSFDSQEMLIALLIAQGVGDENFEVAYRRPSDTSKQITIQMPESRVGAVFETIFSGGPAKLDMADAQKIFAMIDRKAKAAATQAKFQAGAYATLKRKNNFPDLLGDKDEEHVSHQKAEIVRLVSQRRWWEKIDVPPDYSFRANTLDRHEVFSTPDGMIHLKDAASSDLIFAPMRLIVSLLSSKQKVFGDDIFVAMPYQERNQSGFAIYEVRMSQALKMLVLAGEAIGLSADDLNEMANEVYATRKKVTSQKEAWQCHELANGLGMYKHDGHFNYGNRLPPSESRGQAAKLPPQEEVPPPRITTRAEAIQYLVAKGAITDKFSALSFDEQKALVRGLRRGDIFRALHQKVDDLLRVAPGSAEFKRFSSDEASFNLACTMLAGAVNQG